MPPGDRFIWIDQKRDQLRDRYGLQVGQAHEIAVEIAHEKFGPAHDGEFLAGDIMFRREGAPKSEDPALTPFPGYEELDAEYPDLQAPACSCGVASREERLLAAALVILSIVATLSVAVSLSGVFKHG